MKILVINRTQSEYARNQRTRDIRKGYLSGPDQPCGKRGCSRLGVEAAFFQSNHEGDLVDAIQEAYGRYDGIVINPAAYTHTSVALLDALKAVGIPAVEVHISDVAEREDFRQISYVRGACIGTVMGKGFDGYIEAMEMLIAHRGRSV